jgi:hypothetical protein
MFWVGVGGEVDKEDDNRHPGMQAQTKSKPTIKQARQHSKQTHR